MAHSDQSQRSAKGLRTKRRSAGPSFSAAAPPTRRRGPRRARGLRTQRAQPRTPVTLRSMILCRRGPGSEIRASAGNRSRAPNGASRPSTAPNGASFASNWRSLQEAPISRATRIAVAVRDELPARKSSESAESLVAAPPAGAPCPATGASESRRTPSVGENTFSRPNCEGGLRLCRDGLQRLPFSPCVTVQKCNSDLIRPAGWC